MTEIADLSAVELSKQIQAKVLSPVEVTEAILTRIDQRTDLNAFITVCADKARAEAKAAEGKVMQGGELPPLLGIPYSVKDLVNTAGVRTTMGSKLFENNVPKEDGVAVARARAAGAILVGKTTTPEFGHVQSATSPLFGRTLNPIDPTATPGASSAGAAVAVAAGMGPIALGTDGGGSIRIPAACCGVIGFKATLGVIPHLQLPDLFGANSYVGPMARTVADVALLFKAIAGPDARDPYGQPASQLHGASDVSLKGLRVAFIANGGARVEREVAAVTGRAVEKIAGEGALVEEAEIDFKSYEPVFLTMLRVGLAARAGPAVKGREHLVAKSLVDTIAVGETYSGVALSQATNARTVLFQEFQQLFERFDVIVSPTLTAPPLPIAVDATGDIMIDGHNEGTVRGAWYPFTYPQNLTGHPAISIPSGRTARGLPVGLHICAPWYRDWALLRIAAEVEQVLT
ncbi:amidase [Tianweitania sediminis]|uniref:Amidase n=1 Tax=Tianweitania sediminis TaxID=1502156 RepID=A0A8J7UH27_9HYPH|nr:amidase family protein [Tianweitania sediminis]MBP0437328.1 amidase [Tianweitania sediminis]